MEQVSENELWINIGRVADILSLVSVALTIYVFFAIRQVKNRYQFRARVPQHISTLRKRVTRLSASNGSFQKNVTEVSVIVGEIDASLMSLKGILPWGKRKSVKAARKEIQAYFRLKTENNAWQVFTSTHKAIAQLNEFFEDSKWEG